MCVLLIFEWCKCALECENSCRANFRWYLLRGLRFHDIESVSRDCVRTSVCLYFSYLLFQRKDIELSLLSSCTDIHAHINTKIIWAYECVCGMFSCHKHTQYQTTYKLIYMRDIIRFGCMRVSVVHICIVYAIKMLRFYTERNPKVYSSFYSKSRSHIRKRLWVRLFCIRCTICTYCF